MPWTVVAIAMGGGADGEGETPSPVSREDPYSSGPTPPALRAPPPHLWCLNSAPNGASFPAPGAGAVMAISGGSENLS